MYNPSSFIIDELASQNIHIDWQSQKILPDQGLMSHVLEVSSNSGMLILHRIPLNTTHLEWDLQKKYEILKEFFIKYTIPINIE